MCKLKSAIILKDRIFLPDYDSHSEMLEELGIKDDYLHASKTFVRVELSPKNGDVFSDIDTWELNVDQDIVPDWFDANTYKPLMIEKVKAWAKDHIHIGVDGLKINVGQNHYIKDCKDVEVCDSATVNKVCGSATVNKVCGSATVNYVCDSATVNKVCGSATVNYVCGSATVNYVCDSATVNSSPYLRWNKKDKVILCDNATFKDCYEKIIYQAGGWKLVKVKKEQNND